MAGAAVAHFEEEFDDEAFEKNRSGKPDARNEFCGECALELGVGRLDLLFRAFFCFGQRKGWAGRGIFIVPVLFELDETWKLAKETRIDSIGLGRQDF